MSKLKCLFCILCIFQRIEKTELCIFCIMCILCLIRQNIQGVYVYKVAVLYIVYILENSKEWRSVYSDFFCILGVANGKIRDSPRRRDCHPKPEPETKKCSDSKEKHICD